MIRSILFPVWPLEPWSPRWDSHRAGLWGERAVARHLYQEGYRLLAHRWTASDRSDIDLIASDDEALLFAEVKLRSHAEVEDDPWRDVFADERTERLRVAAGDYLRQTRQPFVNIRFVAYLVTPDPATPRHPRIDRAGDYLNPATVPGWKGIVPERFTTDD